MARLTKKELRLRTSRAISGHGIPLMELAALAAAIEAAIRDGKSDADLKVIVAAHPGVTKIDY